MDAIERERNYWGTARASFDDELDAWRTRTARPRLDLIPAMAPSDGSGRWFDLDVLGARVGDLELGVEAA